MKKIIFLLWSSLLFAASVSAQDCAFDDLEKSMSIVYPNYASDRITLETFIKKRNTSSASRIIGSGCQATAAIDTIPIVVHVMYTNATNNISDAQIYGAIAKLNQQSQFLGIYYVPARRDPNGNATKGINRVDCSSVPDYATKGVDGYLIAPQAVPDTIIKKMSIWPWQNYVNIWVVSRSVMNGIFAAYANLPSNYKYQGVVLPYVSMVSTYDILTHEMFHYMGLYHTFQGSTANSCQMDPSLGDYVTDTDPCKQTDCSSFSCGSNTNPSDNTFKNIMGYCSGRDRFTNGQKERVEATLLSQFRDSLIISKGLIPVDVVNEVALDSLSFEEDLEQPLCNGVVTPRFKINNLANSTVASVEVTFVINGFSTTFTLNPGLLRGGSTFLSAGSFPLQNLTSHKFFVSINKVNGVADYQPLNNQKCVDFTVIMKTITVSATVIPSTIGIVTGTGQKSCAGSYQLIAPTAPKNSVFMGWYDDGGNLVTTDFAYPYTTDLSGDIHVTAKYSVTTGVTNSFAQSGFKLYPNPATSSVTLDFGSNGDYMVEIFNSLGQALLNEQVSNTHQKIVGTSEYAKGIYFVRVRDGENTVATEQFLINN